MKNRILIASNLVLVSLLTVICSFGQEPDMKSSGKEFVFMQTDRSYYLPGESVLFKSYILPGSDSKTDALNDTLNLSLTDQSGLEVASENYPFKNNQVTGNLKLSDFLTDGRYILVASARQKVNKTAVKLYSEAIEVMKSIESDFYTDISLTDTLYKPGTPLTAKVKFSGKRNKPLPAKFTYRLTEASGDIASGEGTANSEGMAVITVQLPQSANKEILKLLIAPSYKGKQVNIGVVIPTQNNYPEGKTPVGSTMSGNESGNLNISFKTSKQQYSQKEEVRVDILVTDDKGLPVVADLSVSASNVLPHTSPHGQFIVQEENNLKKIRRSSEMIYKVNQNGYPNERNITDILMKIKPYRIDNGKIIFGGGIQASINYQDGALIVVDGIKMGTDPSILNTIPVPDIARITVSTSPLDIQKYSGLNSVGIIEIFMKKNYEEVIETEASANLKNGTLYWGPDLATDNTGKASVSFINNSRTDEVLISVYGITAHKLYGRSSVTYMVNNY